MNLENRQILLRRRPDGLVSPDDTEMVTTPAPVPADGEALLRTTYVGIDAAARTVRLAPLPGPSSPGKAPTPASKPGPAPAPPQR